MSIFHFVMMLTNVHCYIVYITEYNYTPLLKKKKEFGLAGSYYSCPGIIHSQFWFLLYIFNDISIECAKKKTVVKCWLLIIHHKILGIIENMIYCDLGFLTEVLLLCMCAFTTCVINWLSTKLKTGYNFRKCCPYGKYICRPKWNWRETEEMPDRICPPYTSLLAIIFIATLVFRFWSQQFLIAHHKVNAIYLLVRTKSNWIGYAIHVFKLWEEKEIVFLTKFIGCQRHELEYVIAKLNNYEHQVFVDILWKFK